MPSDIDPLINLPPEQQRIRDKCYHPTGTFIPFPKEALEKSIPERFEEMVRLYPDRLAVKTKHEAVTYAELNHQANQVAHTLLTQGRPKPEPVSLLLSSSIQTIAASLGILKAGGFYVSLNVSDPHARIVNLLDDAQANLIVTDTQGLPQAQQLTQPERPLLNVDKLLLEVSSKNLGLSLSPDTLAYIMYTSGSTGQPKGVMQSHRNVLHLIMVNTNSLHVCAEDRVALLVPPGASGAVWGLFSALCNGASVHPFDVKHERIDVVRQWLNQEAITYTSFVPSLFRQMVQGMAAEEMFPTLRVVFLGAEPISPDDIKLYKTHFAEDSVLVTSLGATETGTSCQYFIDKETRITNDVVPVGYPIPDKEVLLLGEDDNEVGFNQIGEIVVRSHYLSPGYWRQPELTQAKFLSDPAGSDKPLYRSGDLGCRYPDGCVMHIGREDFQIKIRGQRVDSSEIQALLVGLDAVQEAVVIPWTPNAQEPRLVAYLVPAHRPVPTIGTLRRALVDRLAPHMIPSVFVWLDALPLTPARKLDRRALPAPPSSRPTLDYPYVAPRTPIETQLVELWQAILDLDQVGIHDPFLELGGHSLLATQLLSRIIETFRVDLPLRILMTTPTIAEMAVVIAQHWAAQADPATVARLLAEVEAMAEGEA